MNAPAVEVEPLRGPEDLEGILAIDAVSFSHPWPREAYASELAHPDRTVILVARTPHHRVAGYCACWVLADELQIHNLAVLPVARQAGIGRALVQSALAAGRLRGAKRAWLEVRSANTNARRLYRSAGFSDVATRRGYYSDPPDDAVVMLAEIQTVGLNPAP